MRLQHEPRVFQFAVVRGGVQRRGARAEVHRKIARVDGEQRRAGYAAVRWPGRLELVEAAGREVLLDGAHNPAGAASLAQALDDMAPFLGPGRPTLVLAIMADKDVEGVSRALAGAAYLTEARVIATAPAVERALPPEELAARWKAATGRPAETIAEPADALDAALSGGGGSGGPGGPGGGPSGSGGSGGPVVVAGSLYLVGVARSLLLPDPRLEPDPPPLKRKGAP